MNGELAVGVLLLAFPLQEAAEREVGAEGVGRPARRFAVRRLRLLEPAGRLEGPSEIELVFGMVGCRGGSALEIGEGLRGFPLGQPDSAEVVRERGVVRVHRQGRFESVAGLVQSPLLHVDPSEEGERDGVGGAELPRLFEGPFGVFEPVLFGQRASVPNRQVRIRRKGEERALHHGVALVGVSGSPEVLGEVGPKLRFGGGEGDRLLVGFDGARVLGGRIRSGEGREGSDLVRAQRDRRLVIACRVDGLAGGRERQAVDVARLRAPRREGGGETPFIDRFPGLLLEEEGEREIAVGPGRGRVDLDGAAQLPLRRRILLPGEQLLAERQGARCGVGSGRTSAARSVRTANTDPILRGAGRNRGAGRTTS